MNKKELIKRMIGPAGIQIIRKMKMLRGIMRAYKAGAVGRCEIRDSHVRLKSRLSIEGKHVFFGYYDLQQMNERRHVCWFIHAIGMQTLAKTSLK